MGLFLFVWGVTLVQGSPTLLAIICTCFTSTIFWFAVTGFVEPGIIPRNPEPASPYEQNPPLYRNRTEDGRPVVDTWCTTCRVYRPPRASHCPDCDNCVRDFDHHCPFTRNCIGARNYCFFILFLVSVSASLGALIFSCLVLASSQPQVLTASPFYLLPDAWRINGLINGALLVFSCLLAIVLWGFTAYHVSMLCTGFTTKERLKGRKNGAISLGFLDRFACCSPSELEPRRLVPERIPTIGSSQL